MLEFLTLEMIETEWFEMVIFPIVEILKMTVFFPMSVLIIYQNLWCDLHP